MTLYLITCLTQFSIPYPSTHDTWHSNINDKLQNETYDQDCLNLNDSAVCMNRQSIKKHLDESENKMGLLLGPILSPQSTRHKDRRWKWESTFLLFYRPKVQGVTTRVELGGGIRTLLLYSWSNELHITVPIPPSISYIFWIRGKTIPYWKVFYVQLFCWKV